MTQKVLKVGSSAAALLPKRSLEEKGLKIGDPIIVTTTKEGILIKPSKSNKIAELTMNFINRYRKDLEALKNK